MSLDSAIKARLDGSANLKALIGTRSWAVMMPPDTPYPCVMWELVTEAAIHAMGSDANYRQARVQFNSYALDHTTAAAVDEQIRAAMSRYRGTSGGTVIQDVLVESANDALLPEADEGVYHRPRDFRIFYE